MPPEPWDPYIHKALYRMKGFSDLCFSVRGPQPEPWRFVYTTILAQEIVSSIINLQDIGGMLPEVTQARVQEFANQRLQVFIDDYCGTGSSTVNRGHEHHRSSKR